MYTMVFDLSGRTNVKEICFKRKTTLSVLEYANENRHLGSFNDVTICTGDDRFPANKLVLSCFSPFFEKMFKVEMKEKYQNDVTIQYVEGDAMKALIEFIYTGSINVNGDNVCKLLSASDYLQIDHVRKFCFDFLSESINPENCFLIFNIADHYKNDSLISKATHVIGSNFDTASGTYEFKSLSKFDLMNCLMKLSRSEVRETSKYNAVVGWAKHYVEGRSSEFSSLIKSLRLENLPNAFVRDVVLKEDLVMENLELCKLFLQIQVMAHGDDLRKVKEMDSASRVVSLGGSRSPSKVMEVFNCFNESQFVFPDLPDCRYIGSAVASLNYLYYVGGYKPKKGSTRTCWKICVEENELKWNEICSMNELRCFMGAAVFNSSVVVVGGHDGKRSLASGEVYSTLLDTWKFISPMMQRRSGNAVVTCEPYLYSLGGFCSNQYLASVERLLCFDGKWKSVKPMLCARFFPAAVSLNGFIYAIGGENNYHGSDACLKSAEKYDPSSNEWCYISDMNFCRGNCAAIVLQGRIVVVGGLDSHGQVIKAIESYNPATDKWSIVRECNFTLFNHSLVLCKI